MGFAARLKDNHTCPLANPGSGNPHTGGIITGPGVSTVLIGKSPAAVVGDTCLCQGPPDTILKGSKSVLIGGKPAARMGDKTLHGGSIAAGCSSVIIGD